MKIVPTLALLASASAFAPSSQTKSSSASALTAWKDSNPIGIIAPAGFFDPLGFSANKSDEVMNRYRESELKHARVAMAATLGWIITAGGTHPAFDSTLSSNPLEAATQWSVLGWLQFILGCGALEWLTEKIKSRPGYVPGDILGAAYWVDNSDEGWVDYQNKEITNGRLAMLAIAGFVTQDALYGNYGDMIFKH